MGNTVPVTEATVNENNSTTEKKDIEEDLIEEITIKLLDDFKALAKVEKQIITKVCTKISEILVENFVSLTQLIGFTKSILDNDENRKLKEIQIVKWLAGYAKSIFQIRTQLRNYRRNIVHLLKETEISEHNYNCLLEYASSSPDVITTNHSYLEDWSLGEAVNKLSIILQMDKIQLIKKPDFETRNMLRRLRATTDSSILSASRNGSSLPANYNIRDDHGIFSTTYIPQNLTHKRANSEIGLGGSQLQSIVPDLPLFMEKGQKSRINQSAQKPPLVDSSEKKEINMPSRFGSIFKRTKNTKFTQMVSVKESPNKQKSIGSIFKTIEAMANQEEHVTLLLTLDAQRYL